MFTCKVCGSEVERGQAYCATCGAEVVANYEVKCPACGTRNNAGSRFCAHCGELLGVLRRPVCAICGAENLPGSKFCSHCGAPVEDPSSPFTEEDVMEMRRNKMDADLMIKERMDGADSYELAQADQLTMAAGTYNYPDRGTPFDERSPEYRERLRQSLQNSNGSSREGR